MFLGGPSWLTLAQDQTLSPLLVRRTGGNRPNRTDKVFWVGEGDAAARDVDDARRVGPLLVGLSLRFLLDVILVEHTLSLEIRPRYPTL